MNTARVSFAATCDAAHLKKKSVFWLGAISFEERCLGSIQALCEAGANIVRGVALDYPTEARPRRIGEQNRAFHRRKIKHYLGDRLEIRKLHPYRYTECLRVLAEVERFLAMDRNAHLIVDISCFSKVHVAALAYFRLKVSMGEMTIAYSVPELYGSATRNIWGRGLWRSVLLMRLDLDSTHRHIGSEAVAILGHEGDRLRLAIHEAEPQGGVLIKLRNGDTDAGELSAMSEILNARLLVDVERGLLPGFDIHIIGRLDTVELISTVAEVAKKALKLGRRLVLCPFGPKHSVFFAAKAAMQVFLEGTWLSCPMPLYYDAEYTTGYERTYWVPDGELKGEQLFLAFGDSLHDDGG